MVESTTAQIRSRKNTEKSTGLSSDNWGRDTEEEEINTDELNEKVASFSQDILELSAIKAKKISAFKQVSTHCNALGVGFTICSCFQLGPFVFVGF